jgi:uridylate kinase
MFDLFEKWDGTPKSSESNSSNNDTSSNISSNNSTSNYQPYNPYQNSTNSKIFVLSLGGSVFFNEKLRAPEIAKFCEVINELIREGNQFVVVVGGGKVARVYQAGAKSMGANNFELDEVGISVTRANALFFTYGIDNSWRGVLTDPKEAERTLLLGKTPIFGGTIPGQTTDAVAAIIAELLGADFINVSNVDGIYSADPAKEEHAKMYKELTHTKMVSLLKAQASKPGAHTFVDPHAAAILQRSKIRSYFISGNDVENFKSIVRGNTEFKGTIVRTENTTPENEEE